MEYPELRDSLRGYWPGGQMIVPCVIGLSLSEAYHGLRRTIDYQGRRVPITIPPGVHTGAKIYLPRAGQLSARDAEYCELVVHDEPPFKRCGDDLHLEWTIDAFTAILGGTVSVPTLLGHAPLLVPSGTAPGSTLWLPGLGMPVLGHPQQHGDLRVHLQVTIPSHATPLERKLIEDNAWLRGWHLDQMHVV
jgi:curved DNA-binding protein